jgi:hypothetical protein
VLIKCVRLSLRKGPYVALSSVLSLKFMEKFDTSKNGLGAKAHHISKHLRPDESRALIQSLRNFFNELQGQDTSAA